MLRVILSGTLCLTWECRLKFSVGAPEGPPAQKDFQSDAGLLGTAKVGTTFKDFMRSQPMMASLDHAMWFHQPFPNWRADEWLLYVMYSPNLSGARALSHGHIFTQDGRLVVSCTQEGLIRLGKDRVV